MSENKEEIEEMFIIIESNNQLGYLQGNGWKMPPHTENLGIGSIVRIQRVKQEREEKKPTETVFSKEGEVHKFYD